MTKKVCSLSPDDNFLSCRLVQSTSSRLQLKIVVSFAFAVLCLALGAQTTVSAQSKGKRARGKVETRARRVDEKKQHAKSRETSKRDRVARKPEQTNKREIATRRETARREVAPPLVRKTVMISSPQDKAQRAANRPALVNDIVIISEAPVASRLPNTAKTIGDGNSMPSIWPVAGNLGSSGFGMRRNPFGGSSTEFHKGQDISAPMGASVIATADGVVICAGWQRGYGQVVYVDHGNGLSTRYGHLSRIEVVEGQTVKRGELLGRVGSTGRSTGPHLHYEVRVNGLATNPIPYLPSIPPPVVE
jgi:murein DD-endopeptidase MepM/ murein hydrolase activator NlpD